MERCVSTRFLPMGLHVTLYFPFLLQCYILNKSGNNFVLVYIFAIYLILSQKEVKERLLLYFIYQLCNFIVYKND
jgi:hypothetical protein